MMNEESEEAYSLLKHNIVGVAQELMRGSINFAGPCYVCREPKYEHTRGTISMDNISGTTASRP
eukprot:12906783-Prorocentrum_lima.AAC.1